MASGYFRLNVSRNGHFSGKLLIAQHHASFSGKFNSAGTAYVPVQVGTGIYTCTGVGWGSYCYEVKELKWTLILQLTNGLDEVEGQIVSYEGNGWSGSLLGDRAGYSATTNPAPQAGRYTAILPGNSDSQSGPAGDGYAALMVDKAGNVRLLGSLADASKVTCSSIRSAGGVLAIHGPGQNRVTYAASLDQAVREASAEARKGDIVIALGAGHINQICEKMILALGGS